MIIYWNFDWMTKLESQYYYCVKCVNYARFVLYADFYSHARAQCNKFRTSLRGTDAIAIARYLCAAKNVNNSLHQMNIFFPIIKRIKINHLLNHHLPWSLEKTQKINHMIIFYVKRNIWEKIKRKPNINIFCAMFKVCDRGVVEILNRDGNLLD